MEQINIMTNEEILKKATKKAVKNGFEYKRMQSIDNTDWGYAIEDGIYFEMIFSHDFAKAFWGDYESSCCLCDYEDWTCDERQHNVNYSWQHHLQQMVLEEEPIKYLEQFLWNK